MINHIERLKQHISKASFSHGADRHSALQCVAEIEEQLAAIDALDRPDPWTLIKDGLPTSGVPVPADSRKPESTAELDKDQDLALTGMALVTLGTAMQDKSKTIDELTVLALNSGVNIRFSLI